MSKTEVILPAMGEGIIEAAITRWFVSVGEFIQEDDPLLEVATDKVDSEIPSPASGVISRIIYREGEIPKVGEVLAIIESEVEKKGAIPEDKDDEEEPDLSERPASKNMKEEIETEMRIKEKKSSGSQKSFEVKQSAGGNLITPYVRYFAKNRGISFNELQHISVTGLGGRITKEDLNSYIQSGRKFRNEYDTEISGNQNLDAGKESPKNSYILQPGEELIEMDRTRKLIAEHMVRSKRISPHVTSTVEIDVTSLVNWREIKKEDFFKKHGVKLTYTPIIVLATVKALKDFPGINVSVAGDYIVRKKYINIGIATALPDGNLIVPVIKDADKCNFISIARQIADLSDRARKNKLLPAEIKGGTFTITNMGKYDNISGTPIINQPEVAILAVGAIKKKPGVVLINGNDSIGIRDILVLSLTYDHRVIDGSLGGSFVQTIGKYLSEELPVF